MYTTVDANGYLKNGSGKTWYNIHNTQKHLQSIYWQGKLDDKNYHHVYFVLHLTKFRLRCHHMWEAYGESRTKRMLVPLVRFSWYHCMRAQNVLFTSDFCNVIKRVVCVNRVKGALIFPWSSLTLETLSFETSIVRSSFLIFLALVANWSFITDSACDPRRSLDHFHWLRDIWRLLYVSVWLWRPFALHVPRVVRGGTFDHKGEALCPSHPLLCGS